MKRIVTILVAGLLASTLGAEPHWKVRTDPFMALGDFPNIELDRAISQTVSVGGTLWHREDGFYESSSAASAGVRIDWFEHGVFADGWHSNLILKSDWVDGDWDRLRLKGTQTYQWAWDSFFVNAGIGMQLVSSGTGDGGTQFYDEYDPWLLPAWEVSIGRSF